MNVCHSASSFKSVRPLLTGKISKTTGLYDALVGVRDLAAVQSGVLRLADDGFLGLIAIATNNIIGAVCQNSDGKLLKDEALSQMLRMREGNFEYYEVSERELKRIDQQLNRSVEDFINSGNDIAEDGYAEEQSNRRIDTEAVEDEAQKSFGTPEVVEDSNLEAASDHHATDVAHEELNNTEESVSGSLDSETGTSKGLPLSATSNDDEIAQIAEAESTEAQVAEEQIAEEQLVGGGSVVAVAVAATECSPEEELVDEQVAAESQSAELVGDKSRAPAAQVSEIASTQAEPVTGSTATGTSLKTKFLSRKNAQLSSENVSTAPGDDVKHEKGANQSVHVSDENRPFYIADLNNIPTPKTDSRAVAAASAPLTSVIAEPAESTALPPPNFTDPQPKFDGSKARASNKKGKDSVQLNRRAPYVVSKKVKLAVAICVALLILLLVGRSVLSSVLVSSAEKEYAKSDYSHAASTINQVLAIDPQNATAHFLKGKIRSAQNDEKNAFEEYDQALKAQPEDGEILRAHAISAWKLGKINELKSDTDLLIERDPVAKTDGYFYGLRAKAENSLRDYKSSLNDCNTALKLGQKTPWIYVRRGWDYLYLNEPKLALKDFQRALEFPKSVVTTEAYVGKAETFKAMNDYKQALAAFSVALSSDDSADNHARRASLYVAMNRLDDAIADYTRSLSLDPSSTYVRIALADIYSRQNKTDLALKVLNAVPPKYETADSFFARARAYMRRPDYDKAIAAFKEGLKLNPKDAYAFVDLSFCYINTKKMKEAGAAIESAIALRPDDGRILAWRGFYDNTSGNSLSAVDDLGRAITLNPKDPDAYLWRAQAFIKQRDTTSAIRDLEKSLALDPSKNEAKTLLAQYKIRPTSSSHSESAPASTTKIIAGDFDTLLSQGYAKLKSGDGVNAVNYFFSAVKQKPNDVRARRFLAYALILKGSYNDAITEFQVLTSLGSRVEQDQRALADLLVKGARADEAISIYNSLLTANPRDSRTRCELANAFASINKLPTALNILTDGKKIDPSATTMYEQLAEKLQKSGAVNQKKVLPWEYRPAG